MNGKKIAFLGWAFKKDTNDTRESAAIYVADKLLNEQAEITVYDPKVPQERMYADLDYLNTRSETENRKLLKAADNVYDAVKDVHAVVLLTEWDEFKALDWEKIYRSMMKPAFLFEGRNILNKKELDEIGFVTYFLGKNEI